MLLDKEPMIETDSPIRIARVAQLEQLYLEREEAEISPFDDKSADLKTFLKSMGVKCDAG